MGPGTKIRVNSPKLFEHGGAESVIVYVPVTGPAAGRTMEEDEKSEAIIGAWKMVAAGSGLNVGLGVKYNRNGL